eukprot:Lithocolla_globosa_v1_NODE_3386_length_1686_cov_3.301042.p1 type:complete len:531 gc:universal NODE_3386_length_1686_cov_3.301042:64-1656(+)
MGNQPSADDSVNRAEMARKRARVAEEVSSSHDIYVNFLTALKEFYVVPLQKQTGLVSEEEHKKLFANVVDILSFHQGPFATELQESIEKWSTSAKYQIIGSIFLNKMSGMQIYGDYFDVYDEIQQTLMTLQEKPEFVSFCQKAQSNKDHTLTNLSDYLILPLHTLPEFARLLRDLLRHTPTTHIDHADLKTVCNKLSQLTAKVQSIPKIAQSMKVLSLIEQSLTTHPPEMELPQPFRNLVQRGRLLLTKIELQENYVANAKKTGPSIPTSDSLDMLLVEEHMYNPFYEHIKRLNKKERRTMVVKKGWMMKQGGKVKNWKKRFFVLVHHAIFYFEDEIDPDLPKEKLKSVFPKGDIPLEDARFVEGMGTPEEIENRLFLETPTRLWVIEEPNQEVQQEWKADIQKVIDHHQRGSSLALIDVDKKYEVFLFTDMIMLCSKTAKEKKIYEGKNTMDTVIQLNFKLDRFITGQDEVELIEGTNETEFNIVLSGLSLSFKDTQSLKKWVESFEVCIRYAKAKQRSFRRRLGTISP